MPLTPQKLEKIRQTVPEYNGLDDDQLTARLMVDAPELMTRAGLVDPTMQRAFGTGSRQQVIRDVGSITSGAGMVGGGLLGAASPVPGGAFLGSTAGGAAGRGLEMKLYDWLGVPRPDETKVFGLMSLGKSSFGKEMYAGALEGAGSELLPMALAGSVRGAKNAVMSNFEKAAKLPPNAAVAAISAREGLGLGVDEITQSPALRGVRESSSKTAAGATKAQIRAAEVEEKATKAVVNSLSGIGPDVSATNVARSLRGDLGKPGVLGQIEKQIQLDKALKYAEVDKLAGNEAIVLTDTLKAEAKDLMGRAEMELGDKGFGQTMRRSPLGKAIVKEAAGKEEAKQVDQVAAITKGKFKESDFSPEALAQLKQTLPPPPPQQKLTLQEADALRSRYDEIARDAYSRENPNRRLGEAATRLKNAIDADMDLASDKLPQGSQIKQAYDDARKFVSEIRNKSFTAAVKYLSEAAPSELAKSIAVNDVETVKSIENVLTREKGIGPKYAPESMRRIWTHDYFFGEGLPTKTELRTITAKARKLSPEFVEALYGPPNSNAHKAFDRLVEIGRAAERVNFELGTKGTSVSEVNQALDVAAGAAIHGKYMATRGAQRFLTSHFLVKAVNDPKVYDMVVRGIYEYPKNPGRGLALFTQAVRTAYPAAKLVKDATD